MHISLLFQFRLEKVQSKTFEKVLLKMTIKIKIIVEEIQNSIQQEKILLNLKNKIKEVLNNN
jgi:hypothetical protein